MTLPLSLEIQGKYELLAKIKEGGMGAVYKVRHRELGDLRVIKVIRPQYSTDEGAQKRFIREARAASRLRHPNIVLLYDFTVDEADRAYMVMEYIEGVTLREVVSAGAPPIDLALEIARQGLRALAFLHQNAYIHRDISPDNLMLTRDTVGDPLIKLIDLGIVKHMEDTHAELTGFGAFVGKIKYSSPEQWSGGKAPVDARSDLYSFGVILYELLTGRFPFPGAKVADLMWAHRFLPPLSFDETDPERRLPPAVRELVLRALEKDPKNRPSAAEDLLEQLDRMGSRLHLRRDLDQTLSTTFPIAVRPAGAPGDSTQDRVDRQFAIGPTPRPDADSSSAEEGGGKLALLLAEAERATRRGKLKDARRRLYRALSIAPEHGLALGMLRSVESALQQEAEAALRRAKLVEEASAAVAAALAAGRLDEASDQLAAARRSHGEDTRFRALDGELEQARADAERASRERSLAEAAGRVQEQIDGGRLEAAVDELEQARAELGSDARLDRVQSDIERLRARLEAQRRSEIARTLAEVDAALIEERVDDAAAKLLAARASFPEAAGLDDYAERVARMRSERERRARAEALLQQARTHAGEGSIAASILELEAVLSLEPGHAEASELLVTQRQAAERLVEERQRYERLLESARAIEAHIASEHADEAEMALREAGSRLGNDALLEDLAERVAALRRELETRRAAEEEASRRARIDHLVAEAHLLAHDDLEAAIALLEEAASLDPGEGWALGLLQSYRAELGARRRQAAVAAACAAVEGHLEHEDLDSAAATLDAARAELSHDPAFEAAEDAIAAARLDLELRRRREEEAATRERAASLLGEARRAAEQESFEEALELAQAALDLAPDDAEGRELFSRWRAAQDAREERRRREQGAAEAVTQVRALLHRGDLDRALQVLDRSQRELGDFPELLELRAALDARRRRERGGRLVADAQRMAQDGDLAAAVAAIEESLLIDSGNDEAAKLLLAYRERARQEDERRRSLLLRVEAIDACLSREEPGDAATLLDGARAEHGDDPLLDEASARIGEAAAAIEARRRRTEAIEAAVSCAGEALEAGRVDDASELLERCRETHGGDAALDELERRVARVRVEVESERRREEKERRRGEAESLVIAARGLAAVGDLEASIHKLAAALTILPQDPRIWGLLDSYRSEIEGRQRHDAISEAVRGVESHLRNEDADAAARALAAARAELGEVAAIGSLQQRLLDLRVDLEARRRIATETDRVRLAESRLVAAESSAARGDFDSALKEVAMALEIDRRAPRARELLDQYQKARKLSSAEQRQALAVSKAAAKIARLIERGKLKPAERKLRRSLEKYGMPEALLQLSVHLTQRSGLGEAGEPVPGPRTPGDHREETP